MKYVTHSFFWLGRNPLDLSKLDNPKLTLEPLEGLIIIDEIQRTAELFPYLRVLVDKYPEKNSNIRKCLARINKTNN